jgi:L-alanine-DL-glutamate epimerase-like enolase superfamily enzyme
MRMSVQRRLLRLARPLETSYGTVRERELLTVGLTDEDGVTGYGEGRRSSLYDGSDPRRVQRALDAYRPVLMQSGGGELEPAHPAQLLDACRQVCDEPVALAAIDLALWDRAGRRAGRPVAALLTDDPAPAIAVNATIGALDRAGAAQEAARAAELGFGCLKVKVGVGDDAGRLAAVRAAVGPQMELRVDANGAWDVEEAVRAIDALAPVGLELVEEPCTAWRPCAPCAGVGHPRGDRRPPPAHGALGAGVADAAA